MGAKVMNKKDICKKKLRFFIFYHYSGIIIQKKEASCWKPLVVGAEGFEPPTLCLSGRCSKPAELSALRFVCGCKGTKFFWFEQIISLLFSYFLQKSCI